MGPFSISPETQTLHESLIIGDWHADPLLWKRDLTERSDRGHVDIPRLTEGNVALQVFTAVTKSPAGHNYEENDTDAWDNITTLSVVQLWPVRTWNSMFERAVYQAEKLAEFAAASDGQLRILRSEEDLEKLLSDKSAGQSIVGGILGIEGAHALEGDIANLQRLQDAGYRLIGLHHFFDNDIGGSLHGIADNGLTDFGRQVVEEVVARGLILDLAHSSQQVVRDVLEITEIPLVISHTGIFSHCETPRNLPDDLMVEIAASGGVIGIGYWEDVTCDDSPDGVAATIKAAIDLVGEDSVSLGSDYDGTVVVSFDTSDISALTQAMLDIGLSEPQIRKVMGENMVRVLRDRLN
ncbi:MAG: peptidase M19 [Verrucomicrobia bacterium]|nr:peptidase M19 [Verrucomicrobiota bacterium]